MAVMLMLPGEIGARGGRGVCRIERMGIVRLDEGVDPDPDPDADGVEGGDVVVVVVVSVVAVVAVGVFAVEGCVGVE